MSAHRSAARLVAPTSEQRAEMGLYELLANYKSARARQRKWWTWDDEERDIRARACLCCGERGHYQAMLEAHLLVVGLHEGVYLDPTGYVADGHHRIVAARRLGITTIPLESGDDASARWMRDHGPIPWEQRKVGDV